MRPRSRFPSFACVLALALAAQPALAESSAPAAKKPRNPYGSPLDTLMSTRLWTDVPQTKDFVRESHPDPQKLDYQPLTGKDPERPKLRDPANVEALRAELEQAGARNKAKADGFSDTSEKPAKRRKRTAKAKSAAD